MRPVVSGPVADPLPDVSWVGIVIKAGLIELEAELPGFTMRLFERVSADDAVARVVRLRGENHRPEIISAFAQARRWLAWSVSTFPSNMADGDFIPPKAKSKRKRKKKG